MAIVRCKVLRRRTLAILTLKPPIFATMGVDQFGVGIYIRYLERNQKRTLASCLNDRNVVVACQGEGEDNSSIFVPACAKGR